MKKISILVLLSFIALASGPGNPEFDSVYTIGKIPDNKEFRTMATDGDSRFNRALFFIDSYKNGENEYPNESNTGGSTFPCECYVDGDTLTVGMANGFFGVVGTYIRIHKDRFQSHYYEWSGETKPWKMHPDDAEYLGEMKAYAVKQSLILEKAPTFQPKQTLTGYLTLRSADYYKDDGNEDGGLDKMHQEGYLFFTCVTK